MNRTLLFLCLSAVVLPLSPTNLRGAEPAPIVADDGEPTGRKFRDVSPDGNYALLITYVEGADGDSEDRAELIEKKSGKVLAQLEWEQSDTRNRREIHCVWREDSGKVAIYTGVRRNGFTTVYAKAGATFKVVPLPKFPELPENPSAAFKKKHAWKPVKVVTVAEERPLKWLKSGALVLEASTSTAGSAGSWTYTYTFTVGFSDKGKASLEKTEHEEKFDE